MKDSASGRPVRFFALVMVSWVAIRLASMEREGIAQKEAPRRPAPITQYANARQKPALSYAALRRPTIVHATAAYASDKAAVRPGPMMLAAWGRRGFPHFEVPASAPLASKLAGAPAASPSAQNSVAAPIDPAPAIPLTTFKRVVSDRRRASAWVLWRDGSTTQADAVSGGQLGGSQAGFRMDFDMTPQARSRTALYIRASAALNRPVSPEAAMGLSWQPERSLPISLAAERRIALGEGARNANALMAVGGFGPSRVAPMLEVEGYAQGGMAGFRSHDFFIGSKMSLLSPIERTPVRLGASLSGGAQPQVERLDFGPELQIRLPTALVPARLAVEWRERIAGAALPASGLAVTIGADF